MKRSSKIKLTFFVVILAAVPTTAFARGERIAPKGGILAALSSAADTVRDFFDGVGRKDLVALNSQENKDAIENEQDIRSLVNARADKLCQLKSSHYKGAAQEPSFVEKVGPIDAADWDEAEKDIVLLRFNSVQGPVYSQKNVRGTPTPLTKKQYLEIRAKAGRYAESVQETTGPIPIVVITDLKCSDKKSLTGVTKGPKAVVTRPAPEWAQFPDVPYTLLTDQEEPTLSKSDRIRAEADRLAKLDQLIEKLHNLIIALNPALSRAPLTVASSRVTKPVTGLKLHQLKRAQSFGGPLTLSSQSASASLTPRHDRDSQLVPLLSDTDLEEEDFDPRNGTYVPPHYQ